MVKSFEILKTLPSVRSVASMRLLSCGWFGTILSYLSVCFKENWQDKDRRILCPKDESQEDTDSQDSSSAIPFRKVVSSLWWIVVVITYLVPIPLQLGEGELCN